MFVTIDHGGPRFNVHFAGTIFVFVSLERCTSLHTAALNEFATAHGLPVLSPDLWIAHWIDFATLGQVVAISVCAMRTDERLLAASEDGNGNVRFKDETMKSRAAIFLDGRLDCQTSTSSIQMVAESFPKRALAQSDVALFGAIRAHSIQLVHKPTVSGGNKLEQTRFWILRK